ncbi:Bone morphoproteintic protein 1 [Sparganum proliferum]
MSDSKRGKINVPETHTQEETDDRYPAVEDSGLGPMNSTNSRADRRNLDAPYLSLSKVMQVQYGYPDSGLRPQSNTGGNINVSVESGDSALWTTNYPFEEVAQEVKRQTNARQEAWPPLRKLPDAESATAEESRWRSRGAIMFKNAHLWPHGVIPYEIDSVFSDSTVKIIKKAMRVWEKSTCVIFVEKEPQHRTYINFTVQDCGYCSFVGRTHTESAQTVSIAPSCKRAGKVMHELGHVMGLYHEQSRPDRDDEFVQEEYYVEIFEGNILKEALLNFEKTFDPMIDSLGEPYDYDSIMHYHSAAYAKPGENETIRPKRCCPHPQIGQRVKPSPGDIRRVNKLYRCPSYGQTLMEYSCKFASPQSESLPPTADSNANTTASSSGALFCQWRIIADRGEHIRLNFTHMDMLSTTNQLNDDTPSAAISQDSSKQCEEEYVEVRDGYYSGSPLIGRYCGSSLPPTLTSLSPRMLIEYRRPSGVSSTGFVANYRMVCGTYIKADNGVINSSSYESNHLPDKECIWRIEVSTGFVVALSFDSFEIGEGSDCLEHYLEIYDGLSTSSPVVLDVREEDDSPSPVAASNSTFPGQL